MVTAFGLNSLSETVRLGPINSGPSAFVRNLNLVGHHCTRMMAVRTLNTAPPESLAHNMSAPLAHDICPLFSSER